MKVYLAGSSDKEQIARIEVARQQLIDAGHEIVSTWIDNIRAVGSANPRDASGDQREAWAVQCLQEVQRAEVLWFLVPDASMPTRGAWCELAYAWSRSTCVVVCSGDTRQSIFCALGLEFDTDAEALDFIQRLHDVEAYRLTPPASAKED